MVDGGKDRKLFGRRRQIGTRDIDVPGTRPSRLPGAQRAMRYFTSPMSSTYHVHTLIAANLIVEDNPNYRLQIQRDELHSMPF